MLGAGLMYSGADPQLADLDDASLHRELLCHALQLMTPRVRQA
jgi:hypothetical protein